jgi:hypothetical protein
MSCASRLSSSEAAVGVKIPFELTIKAESLMASTSWTVQSRAALHEVLCPGAGTTIGPTIRSSGAASCERGAH